MVLVLGAETYLGRIFCAELRRRRQDFILPPVMDYCDFNSLFNCIRKIKPAFVVNATSYAGMDMDANEPGHEEVLRANIMIPRRVAQACLMTNTPWGHVSSCGIYSGAKVVVATGVVAGKKIARADLVRMIVQCPEKLRGFTEADEPNFSFRAAPCNFFSGTVALAEEAICDIGRIYIWRLGQPFNERNDPENFLRKLQYAEKVYDGVHPLSHTDDFAQACLDLWERGAPFGIYNVAHPGFVTTGQIVEMIRKILKPSRHFDFWHDDVKCHGWGNRTPRSCCILDASKLLATGVAMRPAAEAIEDSLINWRPETIHCELHKAAA